jgi:hypothetical protein
MLRAVLAAAVLAAFTTEAANPWLLAGPTTDSCIPTGTADTVVCHPTACAHLFNSSSGTLTPTPVAEGQTSSYSKFACDVETYNEYSSLSTRQCKRPKCRCVSGGATCYPLRLQGCVNHTCS